MFSDQTPQSLADCMRTFSPENFDPARIRQHALQFSKQRFAREIQEYIEQNLKLKSQK
ncbi:MAG: hypothetical protein U9Q15_02145 [Patescibacteria group bacterium]|nr:hypothetical protein [Patescibacteria group bacterium]